VAIPAMFAYNYMVTTIRALTQELDGFAAEYATQLEHKYVDNRGIAGEIRDALQGMIAQPAARARQVQPSDSATPCPDPQDEPAFSS